MRMQACCWRNSKHSYVQSSPQKICCTDALLVAQARCMTYICTYVDSVTYVLCNVASQLLFTLEVRNNSDLCVGAHLSIIARFLN